MPPDIDKMLEEAACRGATRALERIGLHDENAGRDVADLRTLIDSWRTAKKSALQAAVQWTTVIILGALVAGFYFRGK
jgi:hypothetical protein